MTAPISSLPIAVIGAGPVGLAAAAHLAERALPFVVLEASAGTGKTYTIAALATRYVAEAGIPLSQLMLVTFGRAATQELRERTRQRLASAARGLNDLAAARLSSDDVVRHLATGTDDVVLERRRRLTVALSDFDAATITTTHSFCQRMLGS
jgi:exodeoxyribonuclease V beta subunit